MWMKITSEDSPLAAATNQRCSVRVFFRERSQSHVAFNNNVAKVRIVLSSMRLDETLTKWLLKDMYMTIDANNHDEVFPRFIKVGYILNCICGLN